MRSWAALGCMKVYCLLEESDFTCASGYEAERSCLLKPVPCQHSPTISENSVFKQAIDQPPKAPFPCQQKHIRLNDHQG